MNKEAPKALLPNYYRDCDIPCIYVSNEWGNEIKHMVGEERKTAVRENYAVSLITNTIPMCLRYEPYVINNTILVVTHCVDNSWFVWNNPPKGRDYDSRCKKIAWGIAAYIGFHCWIGDDGELDWKHGTIEDLYKAYHDEAIQLLKLMDMRYCRAERHNDTSTMQRIGKEIEEQHRHQEETFIEQSKEVASILGTAIYDAAKGYIDWLTGQNEPQQEEQPTAQPQQERQEQQEPEIPTINDTDLEKRVFRNALNKQYMSLKEGHYIWKKTKSLLAYMCGRLYCGDIIKEDRITYSKTYIKSKTQMPAQECKSLFGGVDVANNRYSLKTPPRNSDLVDDLFKGNGADT